jgi:hypothetical protein
MRCFRCGGPGSDWHHRRSRRVRAGHRHCACNGVLLCRTCHSWAHSEVSEAQAAGLIVSQWVDEPFLVPVHNVPWSWWELCCNGDYQPVHEEHIVTDGVGGYMVSRMGLIAGLEPGHTVE